MLKAICIVLLLAAILVTSIQPSIDNGFGAGYNWHKNLSTAIAASSKSGKPVMVIIHLSSCIHCRRLSRKFKRNKSLLRVSKKFEMVNCMDDNEPYESTYTPDGEYYPRIIFVDGNGKRLECEASRNKTVFKHAFNKSKAILECMRDIVKSNRKKRI